MRTTELFEWITDRIIAAIAAGAGDFRMPWHRWGEAAAQPVNLTSGRAYRGINTLMLWAAAESAGYSSGQWATFRQWDAVGAPVRKGEKATPILFWKSAANEREPSADAERQQDDHQAGRLRFLARVYYVFNFEQVSGAEPAAARNMLSAEERIAAAEDFIASTGAQIRHGGDRACYVANIDQIWLPRFEQFRDAESYYSVAIHEAVHWTGAKHRLDRELSGRFGTEAYAMEELVAELGAAFAAAHIGLSVEPRRDHAAYIASWLRVLRDDPRAIVIASAKAQQAVDYLLACPAAGMGDSARPLLSPSMSKLVMHPIGKVTEFRPRSNGLPARLINGYAG